MEMPEMTIVRTMEDEYQSLGEFYFDDMFFVGKTVELPWIGNRRNISRIPGGKYTVVKRNSDKYGDHFHILDVPDRTYILMHHGNYKKDTEGCIIMGRAHRDINHDGHLDVTSSVNTMKTLNLILPNKFNLTIF